MFICIRYNKIVMFLHPGDQLPKKPFLNIFVISRNFKWSERQVVNLSMIVSDTMARTVTRSATPTVPVASATVPVTVPTSVTSVSMATCVRINAVRLVLSDFINVRQLRITYSENGVVNSKMQKFLLPN